MESLRKPNKALFITNKMSRSFSSNFIIYLFQSMKVIIDNNIVNIFIYIPLLIIEFIQIMSIILMSAQEFLTIPYYLNISTILFFLIQNFPNYFFMIWIITCFVIVFILIIISSGIIMISPIVNKKKKNVCLNAIAKILGCIIIFLRTILFIPLISPLLAFIFCANNLLQCWTGLSIIYSIVSIVLIVIFLLLVYLFEEINSCYYNLRLPWSSSITKINILFQLIKLIHVIYFLIDTEKRFIIGFNFLVCVLLLLYNFFLIFRTLIYVRASEIIIFIRGIAFLYVSFIFIIYFIFQIKLDDLIIIIHTLGGIIIGILYIFYESNKFRKDFAQGLKLKLKLELKRGQNEIEIQKIFLYLLNLAKKFSQKNEIYTRIKGFIDVHRASCKESICPCKFDKILIQYFSKERSQEQNKEKCFYQFQFSAQSQEMNKLIESDIELDSLIIKESKNSLLKENYKEIETSLNKFFLFLVESQLMKSNSDYSLIFIVCLYLEELDQNYLKGIFYIKHLNKSDMSFSLKFQIFLVLSHLDDLLYLSDLIKNEKFFELEVDKFLEFEQHRSLFMNIAKKSSRSINKMWGKILNLNFEPVKLFKKAGKISDSLYLLEKEYNKIQSIFPDHFHTDQTYSNFLVNVLGNESRTKEISEKLERKQSYRENQMNEYSKSYKIFSLNQKTVLIVISAETLNQGKIISVNDYAEEVLGFSYEDLVGQQCTKIMPKIIAQNHNKILQNFISTGNRSSINNSIFTFAQSKFGFLVPIVIMTRLLKNSFNGLHIISFINNNLNEIKKTYIKIPYKYFTYDMFFILCDEFHNIISVCSKMLVTFHISRSYLSKKGIITSEPFSIKKLSPELNLDQKENELIQGKTVNISIRAIIKRLDLDYLEEREESKVEIPLPELICHVILIKQSFQNNLNFNVYCFSILENNSIINEVALTKIKPKKLKENIQKESPELFMNKDYIEEGSERIKKDKEIKSLFLNKSMPRYLWVYEQIGIALILLFMILQILGSTFEFIKINQIYNIEILFKYSKIRLYNQFNIEIFTSFHMFMLSGVHEASPAICPNRQVNVKNFLLQLADYSSEIEFHFQDYLDMIDIKEIDSVYLGYGLEFEEISTLGDKYTNSNIPFMTLSHLLYSRLFRAVSEPTTNNINLEFINFTFTPTYKPSSPLSIIDQDFFFIVINLLKHFLNESSRFVNSIMKKIIERADDLSKYASIYFLIPKLFILICFFLSIIIVLIKVQKLKQQILSIYSNIQNHILEEAFNKSGKFADSLELKEISPIKEKRNMENINSIQKDDLLNDSIMKNIESSRKPFEAYNDEFKLQNKENIFSTHQEKKDTIQILDNDNFYNKKRINISRNYNESRSLIKITFSFFAIVFAGIHIIYIFLLINEKTIILENNNFMNCIFYRIYYLFMVQITFLETDYDYLPKNSTGGLLYDQYHFQSLEAEDNLTKALISFPSNQKPVVDIINELNEGNFCENILKYQILFPDGIMNRIYCLEFPNKILDKGLNNAISYFLFNYRYQYYCWYIYIKDSSIESIFTSIRIMITHILNIILIFIETKSIDSFIDYLFIMTIQVLIIFIIFIIISILLFLFFIFCFIEKINREFYEIKGMISLYPLNNSKKNENNEATQAEILTQIHFFI